MPPVDDVVEDSEPEREQRRRRDDVTDDQSDTVLQLSRFVYKTPSSSSRTPDPRPSRPTASLVRKDPPDHLPDSLLVQLSKCISCGLEWTRRKTVKQKHTHIKQCARKHALTKDTIRILVEKEVATSPPTQSINETTLMDSVVPAGPVKRSKRQQVLPTVMSLPETRDSILSRARDILGPTSSQADPQPTQQFGQSALACRNIQHPSRLALHSVDRSIEQLPSTQPFGASSLRRGIMTAEQSVDSCEEPSVGASLFAQDAVSSSDRRKRLASPSPDNDLRTVRRRLLQ
ncbi:hypothetical protein EV363DRAFT_1154945 [Boletus edulis]|nr:hypothetical protein EV363DRAFT_1154945 [Boletus edulis]